jgi:hypothetical protein
LEYLIAVGPAHFTICIQGYCSDVAVYTYFVLQRGHMEGLWRMKREEFVTVDERRRRRSRKAEDEEAPGLKDREVGLCTIS